MYGGVYDISEKIRCDINDYSSEYTPMYDYEYEKNIIIELSNKRLEMNFEETDSCPLSRGEFMKLILINLEYIKSLSEGEFISFLVEEITKIKESGFFRFQWNLFDLKNPHKVLD